MRKQKRGFTLIELLVVISIISLLSSIVLAGLQNARKKANDAKVKSQLAQIRTPAEIYYETNGTYGITVVEGVPGTASSRCIGLEVSNTVFEDSGVTILTTANYPYGNVWCGANGTTFAVAAMLSNNNFWCIDNTGFSGEIGDGSVMGSTCDSSTNP